MSGYDGTWWVGSGYSPLVGAMLSLVLAFPRYQWDSPTLTPAQTIDEGSPSWSCRSSWPVASISPEVSCAPSFYKIGLLLPMSVSIASSVGFHYSRTPMGPKGQVSNMSRPFTKGVFHEGSFFDYFDSSDFYSFASVAQSRYVEVSTVHSYSTGKKWKASRL